MLTPFVHPLIADPSVQRGVGRLADVVIRVLAIGAMVGGVLLLFSKRRGEKVLKHSFFGFLVVVFVMTGVGAAWTVASLGVQASLALIGEIFQGILA